MTAETAKNTNKKVITIDPVGRTEGHIGITITVEHNTITHAQTFSPSYRGFEKIMIGRDPRDAQDLPVRICGVCPMVHSVCASKNLEMFLGKTYNDNAMLMRNIAHGTHMIGDHILHFYHLAGLDYVTGPDKPPFLPRYEGDYRIPKKENDAIVAHYIEALQIRRIAQEAATLFAGKLPHAISFVPGGVTETPTKALIQAWSERIERMRVFVHDVWQKDIETVAKYYPDYLKIGTGAKDYLSMGVFEMDHEDKDHFYPRGALIDGQKQAFSMDAISEDVAHSWHDGKDNQGVYATDTKVANPDKKGGYSFITAARYKGRAVEVGPFSRMKVAGHMQGEGSVLNRHIARVSEAKELVPALKKWANELTLDKSGMVKALELPESGQSYGISEAPRGACGHWMRVENSKISHWQAIPATNWNAAPRDAKGNPGPFELALVDTPIKDLNNPIEAVRVIRSFDPCMACSVHVITPERDMGEFVVTR